MHVDRTKKASEKNREEMRVQFSPAVREALADLTASVHFSNDFDPGIRSVLQDWSTAKTRSVRDILQAFPAVAEEIFRHIAETGDERTKEAWNKLRNQMPENGFTLSTTSARGK